MQREQLNPAVTQHLIELYIHMLKTDLVVIEKRTDTDAQEALKPLFLSNFSFIKARWICNE